MGIEPQKQTDAACRCGWFCKASNRRRAPLRRGPAKILDVIDARATVKFTSRTFKVARYCVRKKPDAQDAGEADWDSASRESDTWDGSPSAESGKPREVDRIGSEQVRDSATSSTASEVGYAKS